MKRVLMLGLALTKPVQVGNYLIEGLRLPHCAGNRFSMRRFFRDGLTGVSRARALVKAECIDEMYRDGDAHYINYCDWLVQKIASYDIAIFFTYSPIHPEILFKKLSHVVKVLGFSDDPHSTYVRGLPYLWAFDAAFFISPSYSKNCSFEELFATVGFKKARWLPLVQPVVYPKLDKDQIAKRQKDVCYVGNPTGSKVDRLALLKKQFGNDFLLHGRWSFRGFYGYVRPLLGESLFPYRVTSVSSQEKEALYLSTKVGFNMHVSDSSAECGNMRTYECAAFGMAQVCDRGAMNLQSMIFAEGVEALYYDDMDDAVLKVRQLLTDTEMRVELAYRAHRRAHAEYRWEDVMQNYLDWLAA